MNVDILMWEKKHIFARESLKISGPIQLESLRNSALKRPELRTESSSNSSKDKKTTSESVRASKKSSKRKVFIFIAHFFVNNIYHIVKREFLIVESI